MPWTRSRPCSSETGVAAIPCSMPRPSGHARWVCRGNGSFDPHQDFLAVTRLADPTPVAWCPTDDAAPGWQCGAAQHAGFPLDQEMKDSSKYLLENGFQP